MLIQTFHEDPKAGVSNPAPGELTSNRFQLQPQSSTPEPANQGLQTGVLEQGWN